MNWQQILINIEITVAAALLTALGSWVLVKVKTLVSTKIKTQNHTITTSTTKAPKDLYVPLRSSFQVYLTLRSSGREVWLVRD